MKAAKTTRRHAKFAKRFLWKNKATLSKKNLTNTTKCVRIAVLKSYRGQHLGAEIVEALLKKARTLGAVRAYVSAQCYAIPFYNKFGFREYGEEYPDGRIPHMDMEMML